ncbi:MAG: hypothetical protein ABIP39_01130, partial [Polyangiaceae bacterium]
MTARNHLEGARRSPAVNEKMAKYHGETITEVTAAIAKDDVVVVGMAQNPHVRNVRKALDKAASRGTNKDDALHGTGVSR